MKKQRAVPSVFALRTTITSRVFVTVQSVTSAVSIHVGRYTHCHLEDLRRSDVALVAKSEPAQEVGLFDSTKRRTCQIPENYSSCHLCGPLAHTSAYHEDTKTQIQ